MVKKSKRTNKRKVLKRHYIKKNKKTRKFYKRKKMKGGSEDLLRQFMEFTGLDETQAGIKLAGANGNIQKAMDIFLSEKKSTKLNPIQILRALIPELKSDLRAKAYLEYPGVNYDIQKAEKLYEKDKTIGMGAAVGVAGAPGGVARAPAGAAQLFLYNGNMLEVSYEQHNSREIVGYLIAGNAGKVGGGLRNQGDTPGWSINCDNKCQSSQPQEEGSFTNFCCATRYFTGSDVYFFDRMKAADRLWGMIDLSDTGVDFKTKQGVDYTKGTNFKFKYERCVYVGEMRGYSQKGIGRTLEDWDTSKSFPCKVFITAGPQARNPGTKDNPRGEFRRGPLSDTQSMKRTYDAQANIDNDYLINSIRSAYIGSLREMDSQDVTVAIVPGLSTGVYAPPSKQEFIKRAIPQIIDEAITAVPLTNIKKVIYCHPDNNKLKMATRATRETGSTDVPRKIMAKLTKFKKKYASPKDGYNTAFGEIEKGRKKSCWSWWIWPVSKRDAGDKSEIRKEWSLSEEECKYFILDPELGNKWAEIMEELLKKLNSGSTLLYLTGNNPRDEEVVKQSCSFFKHCASKLDNQHPIVQRVLNVSNNILSKA